MKAKHLFVIILCVFTFFGFSQVIYGVPVPLEIKKKCDAVIISEIGQKAFEKNIHFIKCDAKEGTYSDGGNWKKYTVYYSFVFDNVKESHVIFSLDYKEDPKESSVKKDIAFKNYTRLPGSIKTKGAKIIDYAAAKKLAIDADPVFKQNQEKLYGEISTEYDNDKKDYFFMWYFYHMEPCKNCEAEMYSTSSVYINAHTGKIINVIKGK